MFKTIAKFMMIGSSLFIVIAIVAGVAASPKHTTAATMPSAPAKMTAQPASAHHAVKHRAPAQPTMTDSQRNAVDTASQYLQTQAFSKQGLINQLSSSAGEGYPKPDAVFAVSHIHVDWNQQAVKSAREYLNQQSFSEHGLIEQLSSPAGDGFTLAQAKYAVGKVY